MPRVLLV